MIIENIEERTDGLHAEVRGWLKTNTETTRIWFRWRGSMSPVPGDAFLLLALRFAMRHDHKLVLKGTVSESLMSHLEAIQRFLMSSDRKLSQVDVEVEEVKPLRPVETEPKTSGSDLKSGVMVTGGLDTFYLLQEHLAEIDHLVYIRGFEDRSEARPFRFHTFKSVKRSASELNINLVEVETNLKDFFERNAESDHSLGITAVGSLLSDLIHKLYIPHNHSNAILFSTKWQNPGLGDLVGNDRFRIIQTGSDVTKEEKAEAVLSNDRVMETLRVCWENPNRAYNCGRCQRCSRTMSDSEIVHFLD
jgi:hypothetical protein